MRAHLRHAKLVQLSRRPTILEIKPPSSIDSNGEYSTVFKELFCVAAAELADLIQVPFSEIGVLYGAIMNTGTLSKPSRLKTLRNTLSPKLNDQDRAERGQLPSLFGRGQLLFVVRQVNKSESSHLQASGHSFANITNVIDILTRKMEVTREELLPLLEGIRRYSEHEQTLEPGVHLACFALRPIYRQGFDILVRKDAGNLLPTTFLSPTKLEDWQMMILQAMDNWTIATCLERLRGRSLFGLQRDQQFTRELFEGISDLATKVPTPFFEDARLVARPMFAGFSNLPGAKISQQAFVVAFRIITDAHENSSVNGQYEFVPSRFFICQQHAYRNCPDNEAFSRRIHREFAAISDSCEEHDATSATSKRRSFPGSSDSCRRLTSSVSPGQANNNERRSKLPDDNSSEKNLVDGGNSKQTFGGVHSENEVSIDVNTLREQSRSPDVEMRHLSAHTEAVVEDVDRESFAEKLMILTIDERRRQRTGL